jgi:hypothetical protein
MLHSLYLIHRFVAGGCGLLILLAPEAANQVVDPDREMPLEEKLALQSWGCFVIISLDWPCLHIYPLRPRSHPPSSEE